MHNTSHIYLLHTSRYCTKRLRTVIAWCHWRTCFYFNCVLLQYTRTISTVERQHLGPKLNHGLHELFSDCLYVFVYHGENNTRFIDRHSSAYKSFRNYQQSISNENDENVLVKNPRLRRLTGRTMLFFCSEKWSYWVVFYLMRI